MTDSLATLLRLRQVALDDAQSILGDAIAAEHAAEAARRAAAQAIVEESRVAIESSEDVEVERFSRWLKLGRAKLRLAEQAVADAAAETASRRAEVTLARAAAEATAKAVENRPAKAREAAARAAQREQDEMGARRPA